MKNFRVFTTVKTKRIISGFEIKNLGMILLLLLMLPYPITFFCGNLNRQSEKSISAVWEAGLTESEYQIINRTELGEERIPLELYVADKLSAVMTGEEETEALKAQAVLIRTELVRRMRQVNQKENTKENEKEIEVKDNLYGREEIPKEIYEAVAETAGQCIVYEDVPIIGAYFELSSGMTRTGEEAGVSNVPYLKSVACGKDYLAENYSSISRWTVEEFEKLWLALPGQNQTKEQNVFQKKDMTGNNMVAESNALNEFVYTRDNVGYVLYIEYEGKNVSGEDFKEMFGLDSACFTISKKGNNYLIKTKGIGHGLGMSLHAAKLLAAEGKTYIEILKYFFQDVTIVKIE